MSPKSLATKSRAMEYFLEHLPGSSVQDSIAKIFLFGSFARGEVDERSDVDLLVFSFDRLREVREACADASFEAALKYGESVEPLVYCVDDLRYVPSHFLYSVLSRGKEIYTVPEEELVVREARNYLDLAREYLAQAKNSFGVGDLRLAVDGAYNACELCCKGLLLLKLNEIPRTYGGIVQKFGELYVKAKIVPELTGRRLNLGLDLRNRARYDFHARIDREDAAEVVKLAEALIDTLNNQLMGRRMGE